MVFQKPTILGNLNHFKGKEAVQWLIDNKICKHREAALQIGQLLVDSGLIFDINNKNQSFKEGMSRNVLLIYFIFFIQINPLSTDLR
jgi:hypothetical protein